MKVMSKYIHESNLVEGIDSPEADEQSTLAWRWLLRQKTLDNDRICNLQKLIVKSQQDLPDMWRGTYRDRSRVRVMVGGRSGAEPTMVPRFMDNWLLDYPNKTPKENHIAFEKIHPFADGNGRTGRMLMWYQEHRLGQELTFIDHEHVAEYYDWFA